MWNLTPRQWALACLAAAVAGVLVGAAALSSWQAALVALAALIVAVSLAVVVRAARDQSGREAAADLCRGRPRLYVYDRNDPRPGPGRDG